MTQNMRKCSMQGVIVKGQICYFNFGEQFVLSGLSFQHLSKDHEKSRMDAINCIERDWSRFVYLIYFVEMKMMKDYKC